MADEPEPPDDESGEGGESEFVPETPELFVEDGGGWLADAPSLVKELGAVGFTMSDGGWIAYVRGKGAVALGELLKGRKPKAALAAIKGDKA